MQIRTAKSQQIHRINTVSAESPPQKAAYKQNGLLAGKEHGMLISVLMVAYNEEHALDGILGDILHQTYSRSDTELIFIDNNSSDATAEVLCRFRDEHINEYRDIKVLHNDSSVISSGLNLGLEAFTGDAFVRVDAHASIADDFLEQNVACLEGKYTGQTEYACGGLRPTYSVKDDGMSRMLLAAEESRFGSSAASYRRAPKRCYIDSIFQGAYRREVVEKIGKYDPRLLRTEDNNYNYRVREAGFRICFEPNIRSKQQIRSSLPKMLKQKYQNGYWIGFTLGICPGCVSPFHIVPFAFLAACIACSILAVLSLGIFGAMLWGAYLLCSLIFSIKAVIDAPKPSVHMLLLPIVFLLMHILYGIGTALGIADIFIKRPKK